MSFSHPNVFVWICVCELYCCSFLANIAFQPVMLVVCRRKLFVHGSKIKQSKPIASRLYSVRFCILHWKGHEVLYGDLCLCRVGNETCNKMCASRFYCSITGTSGISCRLSSQWGKVGHKNSWIWGFCTCRSLFFSVCRRPLNSSFIFFHFYNRDLSEKSNCII